MRQCCLGLVALSLVAVAHSASSASAPRAPSSNQSAAGVLRVDGKRVELSCATFSIVVSTERWDQRSGRWLYGVEHASVRYSLELTPVEDAGADGAPSPAIQDIPVARAMGGRHPSLAALGAISIRESDGPASEDWDAWFGNDAPSLSQNMIRFQGWNGRRIRIHWSARYPEGARTATLTFDGWAEFAGVDVFVRDAKDADLFLTKAWGGQPLDTFEKRVEPPSALPRDTSPRATQATQTVTYMPKGLGWPE